MPDVRKQSRIKMKHENKYYLGLDVGSTTVKGVLMSYAGDNLKIIWKCYERHETKQAEKVLEFLNELEVLYPAVFSPQSKILEIFITGSGGSTLRQTIGAHFYQEVSSVSSAVEKLYPDAKSVIELGGQDAKIILFKEDKITREKKKIMTMNDKCAGGTGAVIDKIAAKLQLSKEELIKIPYTGIKLHPIAGKCGVFAETDINGLQKQGIVAEELMASLFEAIVQQNLSVLTRGNTLLPRVLLLGGPNFFLGGLQDAWKQNLHSLWQERGINLSAYESVDDMVIVPENANYFAAMGAVYQGIKDHLIRDNISYQGTSRLVDHIKNREKLLGKNYTAFPCEKDRQAFYEQYIPKEWAAPSFKKNQTVKAYIGLDSGSTSTKGVLVSEDGDVIGAKYMLSKGNPIEDSKKLLNDLRKEVEKEGAKLEVIGVGTTGYGKDMLKDVLQADISLVETVAHTLAAKHYYPNVDVIVDVGGQDIKLILLKDGIVKDFKLNTQCSAGNGYFLQNTAEGFGYKIEDFADVAFSAHKIAEFGYGCAVFLQTDIVDFQRQGWEGPEIMAGLAEVLPKNIWQYVAGISNLELLGSTFVLQGGTQKNHAAVKSQVDYIKRKFKNSPKEPAIHVHRFTSVCGAIGAALEAREKNFSKTSFPGFEAIESIGYKSTHNESTRCHFCRNKCIRTFIDIEIKTSKQPEKRRLILAPCDKGKSEIVSEARKIEKDLNRIKADNPNLIDIAAHKVWDPSLEKVRGFSRKVAKRKLPAPSVVLKKSSQKNRKKINLGFPRVLNHYVIQPFLNAYFETLGFDYQNFYFSPFTDEEMYKAGSKRGAVDPCFPAKVSLSHVSSLLKRYGEKLDYIVFPMTGSLSTGIKNVVDNRACPTVCGSPEMVYSAITKEEDIFAKQGIQFLKPYLSFDTPGLLEQETYRAFSSCFGISDRENRVAVRAGLYNLRKFQRGIENEGKKVIETVASQNRVALVLLGRTYHNDPGINHGIFDLFVERGYPVLPISALPKDLNFLMQYFSGGGSAEEIFNIDDVWKNSFSASSTLKIWAAKVIARVPNLIPVELSSFKCGHDSTLYSTIEKIFEKASKPFFSFKDIDENNPTGSIKIRVETIDYFLKKYISDLREENLLRKTKPSRYAHIE